MKRAFTLVELIICIAIVAIIASVAIPNIVEHREQNKNKNIVITEDTDVESLHEISIRNLNNNSVTSDLYMSIITVDGVDYLVVYHPKGLAVTPLIHASDAGAYPEPE